MQGVTSDTRRLHAPTVRPSRGSSLLLRPVVGRRDAVRALIEATALAEAITPREVIRTARAGSNAPYACRYLRYAAMTLVGRRFMVGWRQRDGWVSQPVGVACVKRV